MSSTDQQQPQLQTQESAFVQYVQPVRGDLPPPLVNPFDVDWGMPGQLSHQVPVFNESILKSLSELEDGVKKENKELIENIEHQFNTGVAYVRERDSLKAAECFKKAAEFCGQLKMHKQEDDGLEMSADCLFCKSWDCWTKENYEEAMYYLGESSKIYERLKITEKAKYNLKQMVTLYGKMADNYLKKGDLTKAMKCFEDRAELLTVPEDKTECLVKAAGLFFEKRSEYVETGETEKAIECCGNSVILFEKAGMLEGEISCLENKATLLSKMAVGYIKAGNPSKAAEYYDEVLKLYRRLGTSEAIKKCLELLAGSFQCMAESCKKSLKLEDAANNFEKAAKFYNLLKDVEEGGKCLTKAADCFCDAAKGYASKRNSLKAKECYGKAAALYKKSGNTKEAKKLLKKI